MEPEIWFWMSQQLVWIRQQKGINEAILVTSSSWNDHRSCRSFYGRCGRIRKSCLCFGKRTNCKVWHPREVFQDVEGLENIQLGVPKVTKFAWRLRQKDCFANFTSHFTGV